MQFCINWDIDRASAVSVAPPFALGSTLARPSPPHPGTQNAPARHLAGTGAFASHVSAFVAVRLAPRASRSALGAYFSGARTSQPM